jgi:predicted site-specific integrase-resolvase
MYAIITLNEPEVIAMKLSDYAKTLGIKYQTAHGWFKHNKIPGAYQTATGAIIVPDSVIPGSGGPALSRTKTVVYARVSSNEQRKTNLETQAERMVNFCLANGWIVDQVIKEVGSGLNDERKKLMAILKDNSVKRIVVEHRDRLTRFGFNYLIAFSEVMGFEIIVANQTLDNDKDDLMADFKAIITSFCAGLYSQRRGKIKAD